MELHERGVPKRTIARQVGLSRQTVIRWTRAAAFPERKPRTPAPSKLDRYRAHLEQRVREGCHNAAQLHREIRAQGYRGGVTIVREAVRVLKAAHPAPPARRVRAASVRRTAWLLCLADDDVPADLRPYIQAVADASSEIRALRRVACEFTRILRERDRAAWNDWLQMAAESPLSRFAASLKQDEEAVRAAAELPWSTSPVEGHVNRLKLVKRSMYGRAGFALLRARVLAAA